LLVSLVAAAAGGALAARPTGVTALDVAWSAAYVGALAYVSVTAPRLHLLGAAGVASVLAGTTPSLTAAVLATLVGAYHATQARASARLSGITGGLLGLSLLTGSGADETWTAALTTTAMTAFVVLLGLRGMTRRRRRRVLRWSAAVVGVLLLCAVAGGVAALRARTDTTAGIDYFRVAQRAATAADLDAAVEAFGNAETSFDAASTLLGGVGQLGRLVPGLSQQMEAAATAVDAAEEAAEAARLAGSEIDLDAIGVQGGAVDLAVLQAAEQPVAGLVQTMIDTVERLARIDRALLLGPVSDALDDALQDARDAGIVVDRLHRSVQVAPALLGQGRPARYLIVFTSPVEARGRFGFPGSFAILRAEAGRLSFERADSVADVQARQEFDQLSLRVHPRAQPYLAYGVTREWRSITIPAHAPASADLAVQLAAQSGLGEIDGVVYAAPEALASIIGLVGDVPLEEVGVTLTEDNTADFLTRQQYLQFPELGQQADRKDLLVDVAALVGERLPLLSLPRAQDVLARFGPLVESGDLLLSVPRNVSHGAADLLADVGLDGGFPSPGDDDADVVLVTQRNITGNKIDLFLRRRMTYDVVVDRDGQVTADLVVELTNAVPDGDLPPYLVGSALDPAPPEGTNLSTTLVYSRYPLAEITLDGEIVLPPVFVEGGFHVYQVQVDLSRGQTRTLQARFTGDAIGPAPYEVVVEAGGLLTPDDVTVSVRDDRTGDDVESQGSIAQRACVSLRTGDDRCT
jgi:hypothetical protein